MDIKINVLRISISLTIAAPYHTDTSPVSKETHTKEKGSYKHARKGPFLSFPDQSLNSTLYFLYPQQPLTLKQIKGK